MKPQILNIHQKGAIKQLLRNIDCKNPFKYLTTVQQKKALNFPQICINNNFDEKDLIKDQNDNFKMLSIDCQMVETQRGSQVCNITIVDDNEKIVFQRWFKPDKIIDYLPHITNLSQKKLNKLSQGKLYSEQDKEQVKNILKGHIIVGHDLANDFKVLQIQHHAFIDTVALLPHRFGLPFKYKLKDLAMDLLQMPIQWINHDPQEDALAALKIVKQHINDGRGTIEIISADPQYKYNDIWQIINDVELDPKKVLGLFLRGSRALGINIETKQHTSDWDYIIVYDTPATLNGRLITVPDYDLSFFDKKSFNRILADNDVSIIQVFYLPEQCKIVNKINKPQIDLIKMRQSLGFHLSKTKMKIKRFSNEQGLKYKWKILKAYHMQIRFMDTFLQFNEFNQIMNIKRMNSVWQDIKKKFQEKGSQNFKELLLWVEQLVSQKMNVIRKSFKMSKRIRKHRDLYQEKVQRQNRNGNRRGERSKVEQFKESVSHNQDNERRQRKSYETLIIGHSSQLINKQQVQQIQTHSSLQIIKQLRKNGLQNLEKYHIAYQRHQHYSNLIQLRYLQSANFNNKLCRQCRGIIVDQSKNYQIIALPYFKFFDYNDKKYSQVDKINLKKAKITEKKDGSIAVLYFYKHKWQVSSSSTPDGKGNYCFAKKQTTTEFRKQFWRIFKQKKYKLPNEKDNKKTFIFQLMSKNHIIVTQRKQDSIILHGVRDVKTLEEQDPIAYAKKYNWQSVVSLNDDLKFQSIQDLAKIAETFDPRQKEGFIVCDQNFNRVKIKCSGYIRMNWLGQLNLTANKNPKKYILIQIVLAGQAETFCEYCPQWSKVIKQFQNKIKMLNEDVWKTYSNIKQKGLSKKQFGLLVSKQYKDISPFIFALSQNEQFYRDRIQNVMNPQKFYKFMSNYQKKQEIIQ